MQLVSSVTLTKYLMLTMHRHCSLVDWKLNFPLKNNELSYLKNNLKHITIIWFTLKSKNICNEKVNYFIIFFTLFLKPPFIPAFIPSLFPVSPALTCDRVMLFAVNINLYFYTKCFKNIVLTHVFVLSSFLCVCTGYKMYKCVDMHVQCWSCQTNIRIFLFLNSFSLIAGS